MNEPRIAEIDARMDAWMTRRAARDRQHQERLEKQRQERRRLLREEWAAEQRRQQERIDYWKAKIKATREEVDLYLLAGQVCDDESLPMQQRYNLRWQALARREEVARSTTGALTTHSLPVKLPETNNLCPTFDPQDPYPPGWPDHLDYLPAHLTSR